MNKGAEHDFNTTILDVNKAKKSDLLTAGIQALDIDSDDDLVCDDNKYNDAQNIAMWVGGSISGTLAALLAVLAFNENDPNGDNTGLMIVIALIVGAVAGGIGALVLAFITWLVDEISLTNRPDPVGAYRWYYPWSGSWFGAHSSVQGELRKADTCTKYEIEVKLKKDSSSTY